MVQHIGTWTRPRGGGAWEFTFAQEWPLRSQRHQLSYTIPVRRLTAAECGARGVGDVGIHYRFQALGVGGGPVAVAPRLTALFSTGDDNRGPGAGAPGAQVNLPVSVTVSPRWVTHANAGGHLDPLGRGGRGRHRHRARAARSPFRAEPDLAPDASLNLMLEAAWERSEAPGGADREESLFIAPRFRWAVDLDPGVQVVPGLAVPIGLGQCRGERELFLYLSLEHGF